MPKPPLHFLHPIVIDVMEKVKAKVLVSGFKHSQAYQKPTRVFHLGVAIAVLVLLLFTVGCGGSNASVLSSPGDVGSAQTYGGSYAGGTATGDTDAGAAFARWVLDQDPGRQYMTDAVVRNEQVLGVKVQPTVTKADLNKLLVALTQGMARTFPGRPLTVNAFYQSGDKLAQADYDPGNGQVNVQFLQ